MFGWLKKRTAPATEKIAHQPPGAIFPWPTGWQLTALDEAIIAVPAAILGDNETIGSVIHCTDNVRLNLPTTPQAKPDERIMIWLEAGQSVWLTKSCTACVMPAHEGDAVPRRFQLTELAKPS
jgi:hypothetical protein